MIKNILLFFSEILFHEKNEEEAVPEKNSKKKKGPIVAKPMTTKMGLLLFIVLAASIYANWVLSLKVGSATFTIVTLQADVRDKDEWEERAKAYEKTNTDLLEIMKKYLSCEREVIQNLENSNKKLEKLHKATKKIENKVEAIDKNK